MTVKWDDSAFKAKLREACDAAASAAAMDLATRLSSSMGRRKGFGVRSAPGGFPNTQEGHLSRSFAWQTAKDGVAFAGSNLAYARYLNNGAIIRPKNGKMIGFPVSKVGYDAVKNSGGSIRGAIALLKATRKAFVIRAKSDPSKLVVCIPVGRGKNARNEAAILLTRGSTILPRPWAKLGIAQNQTTMNRAALLAARKVLAA